MWSEQGGVIGVGYEGRDIGSFIQGLQAGRVGLVADVRLNAISRKKGFSKKALCTALEGVGIRYVHLPILGNPKANRDGFWSPGTPEARSAHQAYLHLLQGDEASRALEALVDEAVSARVAVLCFEASERCCHRALVIEEVKRRAARLHLV